MLAFHVIYRLPDSFHYFVYMSLSVLTSDLDCLVFCFPSLIWQQGPRFVLLSRTHVRFCARSPFSTHPLPFFSHWQLCCFGLEPLLAVSLPFRSSRHGHAVCLQSGIASAAAGFLLTELVSGLAVRGGRERKEGPREGDWRIIGWWGGGGGKMQHRVYPYCCWWGGGDADLSVLYSGSAHATKSSSWFLSLFLSHKLSHTLMAWSFYVPCLDILLLTQLLW